MSIDGFRRWRRDQIWFWNGFSWPRDEFRSHLRNHLRIKSAGKKTCNFWGRRWLRACIWLAISKISAFYFFPGDCLIYQYIICVLLLFQLSHTAQLAKAYRNHPLGPGFDSQVPQIIISLFPSYVHMQATKRVPSYTLFIQAPGGLQGKSHGSCWRTTIVLSQRRHSWSQKSKRAGQQMGQNCFFKTSFGSNTPPPLFGSFLFFLLILYFFILFVY